MPKQKITKEMVVNAAFDLARNGGMEQVIVKNIAEKLGCSVQPIYSYCRSMDSLRADVMEQAHRFVKDYLAEHTTPENLFQTTGHAFVRLAKDEPDIFKLFIMRPRNNVSSLEELYQSEADERNAEAIASQFGIDISKAKELHLNMLIYTVGIGTIFSVTSPGIPPEEIFSRQEAAFRAFLQDVLSVEGIRTHKDAQDSMSFETALTKKEDPHGAKNSHPI